MSKMFMFILLSVYLSGNSVRSYVYQLKHLSSEQQKVLYKVWKKAKPYNLNYTMSAIAFKESSLGRVMYNLSDGEFGSFGVFHNLVSSVYDRYIRNKPKNRNQVTSIKLGIAKRLIDDFDFSFSQSLAELKFWENVAKDRGYRWNSWKYMIVHYNGGTNAYNKKRAIMYYKEIVKIVRALHICKEELNLY